MANDIVKSAPGAVQPVRRAPALIPSMDVFENDREFLLVADLPGVAPDAVEAHLDAGELRIVARQAEMGDVPEFVPSRFERSMPVPDVVESEGVRAELRDGVLRVHLAKTQKGRPTRIPVKAG